MISLGWSSFFSKLSTTYINLEFHFFLSIIFFFPQVEGGPLTTLNYTWHRQCVCST